MEIKPTGKDDEFYYYEHPVVGQFKIPVGSIRKYQEDPELLNSDLVNKYASYIEESGEDTSNWDAFSTMFGREVTSSGRGIAEVATDERTTSYEDDFLSEVYLKTNKAAAYSGLLLGAVADPVTFPFVVGKLLKLGRIGTAALGGGISGGIQPEREEFGYSREANIGYGAAGGAAIGGFIHILAKRYGKTPEELQDAYDNATPKEKEKIEEDLKQIAEEMLPVDNKTTAELKAEFEANRAAADAAKAERDAADAAEQQADIIKRLREREELDKITAEQEENLARIQRDASIAEEEKARLAKEFDDNLARIQGERVPAEFKAQRRQNMEEAYTPEKIERRVRTDYAKELEDKIKGVQNIGLGTGRENQATVASLRKELKSIDAMIQRAESGSKTKFTLDQLRVRRQKRLEDLSSATARRDAMKQRESDVAELVQVRKGNTTTELSRRLKDAKYEPPIEKLPTTSQRTVDAINRTLSAEPVPSRLPIREDIPELNINRTLEQGQQAQTAREQQQVLNTLQQRNAELNAQMAPQPPVPAFARPFTADVQQPMSLKPTSVTQVMDEATSAIAPPMSRPSLSPKNLSGGGVGTDLPPSVVRSAMNMNTTSRAANALDEPRGQSPQRVGESGEMLGHSTLTDPQRRRMAAIQKAEDELGLTDLIGEGLRNGKITEELVDELADGAERAARSSIRDGESVSVGDYIMQRFDETGGALGLGEQRVLGRHIGELNEAWIESLAKLRSLERGSQSRLEEIQRQQLMSKEFEMFNTINDMLRMNKYAGSRASAALRGMKETHRQAREIMRKQRSGIMARQFIFGVDC